MDLGFLTKFSNFLTVHLMLCVCVCVWLRCYLFHSFMQKFCFLLRKFIEHLVHCLVYRLFNRNQKWLKINPSSQKLMVDGKYFLIKWEKMKRTGCLALKVSLGHLDVAGRKLSGSHCTSQRVTWTLWRMESSIYWIQMGFVSLSLAMEHVFNMLVYVIRL